VNVLVGFLLVIHVLASIGLVILILLHSGKGTGVSSMFTGVMSPTSTGTGIIEKNLDRFTIAAAITFALTTLLLMITYSPGA